MSWWLISVVTVHCRAPLSPSPVFQTLLIWQGPNTEQTVVEVNQEHTGDNERLYACVCEYKQNYCLQSSCSSHWQLYWSQRKWHFLIWGAKVLGRAILSATAETARMLKQTTLSTVRKRVVTAQRWVAVCKDLTQPVILSLMLFSTVWFIFRDVCKGKYHDYNHAHS